MRPGGSHWSVDTLVERSVSFDSRGCTALAVARALNVDTVAIARVLATNPGLRQAVSDSTVTAEPSQDVPRVGKARQARATLYTKYPDLPTTKRLQAEGK